MYKNLILCLFLSVIVRVKCNSAAHSKVASNIAVTAAEEAKAAHEAQAPAGQQAAHQVKEQLADKAVEAAKAAQAALAGKETYLSEIHREREAARTIVQEERASKIELENTANSATRTSHEAHALVKLLATAGQLAQGSGANERSSLDLLRLQLAEKVKEIEAARAKLEQLCSELCAARNDLAATKCAARKAIQQAAEARQSAMRGRRRTRTANAERSEANNNK
ncbi:uncharacterized protein CG45076-like [Coccinella septempunctata]|uniref:uncharacterized protein CG45076-like n=1 Tax=Coccinella septempunctata TaxID=41139 RepID=UPI001D08532A|nr:uncharacterized protein CG45076-like [Coccinella septempunctata]